MAFQLFILNLVVGVASFPVAYAFFNKLSDKGYAVAHLLGWFSIAFISFILSHLGIPVYHSRYFAFFAWLGFNLYLEYKFNYIRNNLSLKNILVAQVVLLSFATIWYFVRIGDFKLNTIERTPDFGIIKSFFSATTLPPVDVWLAGKTINYYYFGHYTAYIMLSLSGIDAVPGFFLMILWMFATYILCTFCLGESLFIFIAQSFGKYSERRRAWVPVLTGILTVFFTWFAGNLYSVQYLWKTGFWYPEPTRFIEGTITEIPFYSFFISDLHAHVWGLGIGVLVLLCLIILWFHSEETPLYRNRYIYLISFLLGLAMITNTWDVLTLGLLSAVVILAKYYKSLFAWKNVGAVFACLFIIFSVAFVWVLTYRQEGSTGLAFTKYSSGLWNLFLNWGGFVVPAVALLAVYGRKSIKNHAFIHLVYVVCLFFIIFTEIFFVKDIMSEGPYQRANTFFKVYMQLWLWLGAVSGVVITLLIFPVASQMQRKAFPVNTIKVIVIVTTVSLLTYPVKTLKQTVISKYSRSVSDGLAFFRDNYPFDYQAYLFLKGLQDGLPQGDKHRIIVEASGTSFQDENLFSSYLGWPTLLGWTGHVWTYRGTPRYLEEREADLREIYSGTSEILTANILGKYKADYVIIGSVEKRKYPEVNVEKLLKLGNPVYDRDGIMIIEVNEARLVNPYQSIPTRNVR